MTSSRHKKNRVAFCTCAFSEFSEVSPSGKSSPRRTARVSPASLRLQRHAGRSGLAKLLLSSSTMRSSSQGPVGELAGRAKGELRGQPVQSRRLLHGRIWPWPCLTVPWPRWSGISLGQEQFGPCHELLAIRCSVQCPLCLLGCVRRPVAELNGCPEVHWPYRIDFCTGGFGRGRARPCHGLVGRGFP